MRRKLSLLGALAVAALAATLPASAAGPQTYTDATGDSPVAPDIASVAVSDDGAGQITFAVSFANRTDLTTDDWAGILVNTDQNASTGSEGWDYLLAFDGRYRYAELGRWESGDWNFQIPQTTFASADGETFTVNRADLRRTRGFWFAVVAGLHSDQDARDVAPTEIPWKYELDGLAQVSTGDASFNGPPRAGRPFSVTRVELGLSDESTVRPNAFSCTARLAGRTLKPSGRCTWRLPRSARGKKLVVSVSVAYDGVTGQLEPYSFRVK